MKKYYVAAIYTHAAFMPSILASFRSKEEAEQYAKLVSETQHRDLVVLENIKAYCSAQ